jgi:hypothetical protein
MKFVTAVEPKSVKNGRVPFRIGCLWVVKSYVMGYRNCFCPFFCGAAHGCGPSSEVFNDVVQCEMAIADGRRRLFDRTVPMPLVVQGWLLPYSLALPEGLIA